MDRGGETQLQVTENLYFIAQWSKGYFKLKRIQKFFSALDSRPIMDIVCVLLSII